MKPIRMSAFSMYISDPASSISSRSLRPHTSSAPQIKAIDANASGQSQHIPTSTARLPQLISKGILRPRVAQTPLQSRSFSHMRFYGAAAPGRARDLLTSRDHAHAIIAVESGFAPRVLSDPLPLGPFCSFGDCFKSDLQARRCQSAIACSFSHRRTDPYGHVGACRG